MITGRSEDGQKLVNHLEDRLYQHGLEFLESRERLSELQTVENTYLSIFQGLGGLGMLSELVGSDWWWLEIWWKEVRNRPCLKPWATQ